MTGGACASLLLTLSLSCAPGAPAAPAPTPASSFGARSSNDPNAITPALPASDLAAGKEQRFLLVLLDGQNRMITDAAVDLLFAKVTGQGEAQVRSNARTQMYPYRGVGEGGIYVARAEFNEPGEWGVIARVTRPGKETVQVNAAFQVKEKSATPGLGEPVPASQTPTGKTQAEIEGFSSARPADPALYRISVADALKQGKPLVVLFATPGYCTSRTCGPTLEVLQALQKEFGERAHFVHVEIYKGGKPPENVPAVDEWHLPSEPWLFMVRADGRLFDKFEGAVTVDETQPRLAALLAAS